MKKILTVLTGAGISAESGIDTFRGAGGLWEGHDIMEVASSEGWQRDFRKVLDFYNIRRRAVAKAQPNDAHLTLKEMEEDFDVRIITPNIDNLHEQAGSSSVLHLHGEITKARSSKDENLIRDIGFDDILEGDLCELGSQLRPHIVWFGEPVPAMEDAITLTFQSDHFLVIGTSLEVYPAASLLHYAPEKAEITVIDPGYLNFDRYRGRRIEHIMENAGTGVVKAWQKLKK
jgi:NAD-dependent deacetylase